MIRPVDVDPRRITLELPDGDDDFLWTPPAETDRKATILTHCALVSSVLARAGCTRTCPVGGRRATSSGSITTCSVPPTSCTPSRRGRHRGCLRCGLSGTSSDKYESAWIQDPQIARTGIGYYDHGPMAPGVVARQCSGTSPTCFAPVSSSLEVGMKVRSPHPVGGEVVGRHGGRVSPVLGHSAARVEPCCSVSVWRPR